MKKYIITVFLSGLLVANLGLYKKAEAASQSIVISELAMGTALSASDEFVELYNNSNLDTNLSGWSLYYKSATGKTWYKKATLVADNVIAAKGYFLLATENLQKDAELSSGMAQTGGIIQLRDDSGDAIDTIGWGTADAAEQQAAAAVASEESLHRRFVENSDILSDTDNNLNDFDIASTPTPKLPAVVAVPTPEESVTYSPLLINELFPDPQTPQSDSADEFIELYNPNAQVVNTSGWILRDAGGASFVLKDKEIAPKGYVVITSAESKLSLNNSGDIISLFSPNNELVDISQDYGSAKPGLSWGVTGGVWDWNVSVSTNSPNSAAFVETEVSAKDSQSKTKKTTTKKAKTSSSSKKATPKAKTASTQPKSTASTQAESLTSSSNIWSWLLIAFGIGTIGYGIYEYRTEISNLYLRVRSSRKSGE